MKKWIISTIFIFALIFTTGNTFANDNDDDENDNDEKQETRSIHANPACNEQESLVVKVQKRSGKSKLVHPFRFLQPFQPTNNNPPRTRAFAARLKFFPR